MQMSGSFRLKGRKVNRKECLPSWEERPEHEETACVYTSWLGLGWLGEDGECSSNCRSENVEALARWLLSTLGFCLKRQLTFHVGIIIQGNQDFALRSLE